MITIFALLQISLIYSQQTDITYKVTNYSIDGVNYDRLALDADVALSFYECDTGVLCFANQWRNNKSQSYGGVYSLKERTVEETYDSYGYVEWKFTWEFFNTYDSNRGNAAVTFTNIFIGNTVKFSAEIVDLNTNQILIFKGYLENN